MQFAMSAGTIVLREARLLLVHHRGGGDDFWLPPGGRLRGEESIFACAVRETQEETGLLVTPDRILYVEEFVEASLHFCKFWILADDPTGDVCIAGRDLDEPHLVDVGFCSRDEIRRLRVFPSVLQGIFWDDLASGFPHVRYLGLQHI